MNLYNYLIQFDMYGLISQSREKKKWIVKNIFIYIYTHV